MARGKGKRGGGRGSGKRFAAQSAEEIEQRNERLATFDAARLRRRADADAEKEKEGSDDESVDSATREAEREAMMVGRRVANMSVGDDGGGADGEWVEREYKPKGVEGLIETDNPNKQKVRMTKVKDMAGGEAAPMTRKEREEKEKEARAAAYRKRHEAGLTEEYKTDMAKLNEVKARRAAAEAKVAAEKEMEDLVRGERQKAHGAAHGADDARGGDKKKKKAKEKGVPKIEKIAIKKMKTAQLKEALKERELDIQGNAKVLQARLLKYEQER